MNISMKREQSELIHSAEYEKGGAKHFDAALCKELFAMPANEEPAVIIPLGYAADEMKPKSRKSMGEIIK